MYRFRDMLLVAACAAACVGCDGEITVSGEVSDESGTPISEACLYLGDRRYDDALNEFLAGKDTDLACRSRTNGEGHFKMTSIVGGGGDHDYWLVAWKEDYETHSERVWKDDGFPDRGFDLNIVLVSVE